MELNYQGNGESFLEFLDLLSVVGIHLWDKSTKPAIVIRYYNTLQISSIQVFKMVGTIQWIRLY